MSVKLRLKRMGKKKRPFYRIVAADSRAPRNGKFIESVGTYDPIQSPHKVDYKEDRIIHWLSNGAQPTTTVKSLFRGKGLWLKWTLIKQGADEAKIASELADWEALQVEKAKRAEAKAANLAKDKAKKKAEEAKQAEEEAKVAEAPKEAVADEAPATEAAAEEKAPAEAPAEAKAEAEVAEPEEKETAAADDTTEEQASEEEKPQAEAAAEEKAEAVEEVVQEEKAAEDKEDSEEKKEG